MISKLGLLKAPFAERPVTDLQDKKITLIGTSTEEIASLASASQSAAERQAHLAAARRNLPKAYSRRDSQRVLEDSTYTFATVRPLPNLPHPERSLAFLERLKADPGIRAAMRTHKFSVGLLTEMDPLSYTESSHEGTTRILGLNRNGGEVIELRLRTDAYDGYRDYKTIRNTLSRGRLRARIGRVGGGMWEAASFTSLRREEEEEVAYDHGGWTGGEFVLGGGSVGGGSTAAAAAAGQGAVSRREIIAKAAEERMKKQKQAEEEAKRNR
ncbi:hypothetical protein GL218_00809 [Daldinia childiae]|uniref:uncharacterized protein n=1 Tax=Daldinia childiae TaxID=326645 RepID=UPI0014463CD9|nr:uncharacterized protein GL218_00809 [Daldinia childiae]KAF3070946.1 hypothetical protein GL218_00809 [Daldinia childiae]